MSLIRVTLIVLAVAASSRASAGVVILATDTDGEEKTTQRIVMEGQKLRLESKGGAVIFDGATKRSFQLDTENKAYTEFSEVDRAFMKNLVAQSGKNPNAKKPAGPAFQKTGRTDRALGTSCDVYRVSDLDGEFDQEMCLAAFGAFGVQKSDFAPLRAFGDSMSDMIGEEDVKTGWAEFPGVPLISWDLEDGQRIEKFRVTKIEKRSVPASEFAVPAGWKKNPGFAEQMKGMEKQMQEAMKKQQGGAGR
ncbi:MAG TPA: DUF4412 domain-containing protein [Anaeromyxobacteraceae bacterium]|nr:DUF4412 domain-containing protein [Anaeromyxobacteraceae bacterium]